MLSFLTEGTSKEEDAESGKGQSVPQSPHSVEGAIGGPKFMDSDFEDSKTPDKYVTRNTYANIILIYANYL